MYGGGHGCGYGYRETQHLQKVEGGRSGPDSVPGRTTSRGGDLAGGSANTEGIRKLPGDLDLGSAVEDGGSYPETPHWSGYHPT